MDILRERMRDGGEGIPSTPAATAATVAVATTVVCDDDIVDDLN
jgi:hypothetical protein